MSKQSRVGAIIVAAGTSSRMGQLDKVFAPLAGRPLLTHAIDVFEACLAISDIVVVLSDKNRKRGQELLEEYSWKKVLCVCEGGPRRQDSVRNGINRLRVCDWLVIHDGARPCITADLIERGLKVAQETGAAIAAVPTKDTIKQVDSDLIITSTPDRRTLWLAQTPQIFRSDIIERAYIRASGDATDDAMLVERLGYPVKVYHGSYENVKVTTPEDLIVAEAILAKRRGG